MASTKMKIKKSKGGGYEVMVLAKHPMETGLRKDKKTGEKVPAHFIQTMDFTVTLSPDFAFGIAIPIKGFFDTPAPRFA